MAPGAALSETPIVGTIKLGSADHAIELKPQQLTIGGSRIGGSVALSYPSEGPAIVTGRSTSIAPRYRACSAWRSTASRWRRRRAPSRSTAGKSIWPEHAFDFAALDGIEGKLDVGFGSLTL